MHTFQVEEPYRNRGIKADRLIKTAMLIAVVLFLTEMYQMFLYARKAKGCSGEHFDKYRDTIETKQIIRIIGKERGS